MKKASYTRGQWMAVGCWIEHVSDSVADIATFHTDDTGQTHLGRSAGEMMANAKLCAQAPAMLKMLKLLSKQMRGVRFLALVRAEINTLIKEAT